MKDETNTLLTPEYEVTTEYEGVDSLLAYTHTAEYYYHRPVYLVETPEYTLYDNFVQRI